MRGDPLAYIECLSGPVTEQVSGVNYTFERDNKGRFVAKVLDHKHIECFLSVSSHYRRLPDDDKVSFTAMMTDAVEDDVEAENPSRDPALASFQRNGSATDEDGEADDDADNDDEGNADTDPDGEGREDTADDHEAGEGSEDDAIDDGLNNEADEGSNPVEDQKPAAKKPAAKKPIAKKPAAKKPAAKKRGK